MNLLNRYLRKYVRAVVVGPEARAPAMDGVAYMTLALGEFVARWRASRLSSAAA